MLTDHRGRPLFRLVRPVKNTHHDARHKYRCEHAIDVFVPGWILADDNDPITPAEIARLKAEGDVPSRCPMLVFVGTRATVYTLPREMWDALRAACEPMTEWRTVAELVALRGDFVDAGDVLSRMVADGLTSFADIEATIDLLRAEDAAKGTER